MSSCSAGLCQSRCLVGLTYRWPLWLSWIFIHVQPSMFCFPSAWELFLFHSNLTCSSRMKTTMSAANCFRVCLTNYSVLLQKPRHWDLIASLFLFNLPCVWTLLKTILIKKKKHPTALICSAPFSSQHHLVRVTRTWVALQESASRGDHMADGQWNEA